ncbi:MAG: MbcA/ParS/Xre antitoxin family protein [Oricola sp.]
MSSAHQATRPTAAPEAGAVVTKAMLRAAERLGVNARELAGIIGLSEAGVSRLRKGALTLEPKTKAYELAVLFIRLFRSLDAITGGDETVARAWLRNDNAALQEKPAEAIGTVVGLVGVIDYLDARRALV